MILITGSSGFLGQALADSFGEKTISISRQAASVASENHVFFDLTRLEQVDRLAKDLSGYDITHVVHAAGVTPWSDHPNFDQDIQMAKSVVELSKILKIPHLFFLSGWIVYDPAGETPYTEASPLKPVTPYGKSKLAVERYLSDNLQSSVLTILRLASIYGPGQNSPGLIPNFAKTALAGRRLTIGALQTRRDYLYIEDFTAAIQELVRRSPAANSVFNVGSGTSASISEVAEIIKEICREVYDIDVDITEADRINEAAPLDNRLDISKFQELGALTEPTPLKAGLEEYLAWLRKRTA